MASAYLEWHDVGEAEALEQSAELPEGQRHRKPGTQPGTSRLTDCQRPRSSRCSAQGTPLKPPGYKDVPVSQWGGALVADLRCEAVDIEVLEAEVQSTLDLRSGLQRRRNPEFPFLVTLQPALLRRNRRGARKAG